MHILVCSGRLTRDSELRFLKDGKPVLSFSLANNVGFSDSKKTNYFECSIFGTRAEKLVDYLKKGQETIISGEVTLNEYQTKEGDKKASLRVRVNDVTLVGSSSAAVTSAQSKPSGQPVARPVDNFDNYDDDIPFN